MAVEVVAPGVDQMDAEVDPTPTVQVLAVVYAQQVWEQWALVLEVVAKLALILTSEEPEQMALSFCDIRFDQYRYHTKTILKLI
jgi:hypothetical protein